MRQRLPHGFLPTIAARFALGIIHLRCEAAAVRVRKDRLRVIEVGLHADIFARFILYDSCFRRFQRKKWDYNVRYGYCKTKQTDFCSSFCISVTARW